MRATTKNPSEPLKSATSWCAVLLAMELLDFSMVVTTNTEPLQSQTRVPLPGGRANATTVQEHTFKFALNNRYQDRTLQEFIVYNTYILHACIMVIDESSILPILLHRLSDN